MKKKTSSKVPKVNHGADVPPGKMITIKELQSLVGKVPKPKGSKY